jgi:hypothetical protein
VLVALGGPAVPDAAGAALVGGGEADTPGLAELFGKKASVLVWLERRLKRIKVPMTMTASINFFTVSFPLRGGLYHDFLSLCVVPCNYIVCV